MSDKYIIKVTRRTPESWISGDEEKFHYYDRKNGDSGHSYKTNGLENFASTFTEQEVREVIKDVERIYKEYPDINGELIRIEVLDMKTGLPVSMCRFKPKLEIISRFELMEI